MGPRHIKIGKQELEPSMSSEEVLVEGRSGKILNFCLEILQGFLPSLKMARYTMKILNLRIQIILCTMPPNPTMPLCI